MSKAEFEHLKARALSALGEKPLSSEELAAKLNKNLDDVREVVWRLVSSHYIDVTRDWRLKVADLA